jgi:hypothetical protein
MSTTFYQLGGYGSSEGFPLPIQAQRDPTTNDKIAPDGSPYVQTQGWYNTLTATTFVYEGAGVWATTSGSNLTSVVADSGTATPIAGAIAVKGGTTGLTTVVSSTNQVNLTGTWTWITAVLVLLHLLRVGFSLGPVLVLLLLR